MSELRPGDVVLCSCCGAQALAVFTGGADRWREGQSSALLWDHGPRPRFETTHVAPELCIWCKERQAALPGSAPLFRPSGLRSVAELDVAFWATWSGGPSPHAAPSAAGAGRGPCVDGVRDADRGTTRPGTTVGFKAPVERPAPAPAGEVQAPSVLCALGGEVEISPDEVRSLVREAGTAEPYAPPVPCPSCHAAAGEPCRTGTGKLRTTPHILRQDEGLVAREIERARRAAAQAAQIDLFAGGAR